MPKRLLNPTIRQAYYHVKFIDPNFYIRASIEFLLGVDIYSLVLNHSLCVLHTQGLPLVQKTSLGWVILG